MHAAMGIQKQSSVSRVSTLLRAVGDPVRVRLLKALMNADLCVCELEDVLQLPQYTVSKHLAALKRSGLVTDRREGLWVYYSVAARARTDALLRDVLRLIDAHADDDRVAARDLARLEKRLALRVDGKCVVASPN